MPSSRKALIVGVTYQDVPSPEVPRCWGTARDAQLYSALLQKHYSFDSRDIRLLVDTHETRYLDCRPTKARVLDGMCWLVDGAQTGDTLVFAFSGHGTHIQVEDGGKMEDHSQYECLVVEDDVLLLSEIWAATHQLPPGCMMTCFMDTAHALRTLDVLGTCSHARHIPRGMPPQAEGLRHLAARQWPAWFAPHLYPAKALGLFPDGVNGFVFAACAPRQTAQEVHSYGDGDGHPQGALTLAVATVLDHLCGRPVCIGDVFREVEAVFRCYYQQNVLHCPQTPLLAHSRTSLPSECSFILPTTAYGPDGHTKFQPLPPLCLTPHVMRSRLPAMTMAPPSQQHPPPPPPLLDMHPPPTRMPPSSLSSYVPPSKRPRAPPLSPSCCGCRRKPSVPRLELTAAKLEREMTMLQKEITDLEMKLTAKTKAFEHKVMSLQTVRRSQSVPVLPMTTRSFRPPPQQQQERGAIHPLPHHPHLNAEREQPALLVGHRMRQLDSFPDHLPRATLETGAIWVTCVDGSRVLIHPPVPTIFPHTAQGGEGDLVA
ncbi:unnamed protein product [Vitrella brassicaformis CCMP3155]|uniref:Peptidase C14 caspase domain-containing protein n=1 Tax=Vitrella brassicaformis (strain CCMP3155) TaxID=1169540 RepID=A0A0G4GDS5_VITBC|nr:unnamed protein product [Vitrella brassicaformis CCMP3155]|eukprot:CEM27468.1 unnamed protein product [Vitrella brassicaformis CCMP3155]